MPLAPHLHPCAGHLRSKGSDRLGRGIMSWKEMISSYHAYRHHDIMFYHDVSCIHGTLLVAGGSLLIKLSTHTNSVGNSIKVLFVLVGHLPSLLLILGYLEQQFLMNIQMWIVSQTSELIVAWKFPSSQGRGLVRCSPHGMFLGSAFSSCTPGQLPPAKSGEDVLTDSHGCLCFYSFSDELNAHPKRGIWLSSTWAYFQPSRLALWPQEEWTLVLSA